MALVLKDRVKETSTSTGTGNFVLAGAATGFQSFASALADGDTTYYAIEDGTDWETGLGTWTEATSTLARTTVYESSNSGNAVDWGAGSKNVFITQPASRTATIAVYPTIDDLPLTGNVQAGDQAFVSATNRLYLFNGSGWYNIALINLTPTIDTQPDANYGFDTYGTALTVTLTATDPEGFPLTWSANTTGMTGLATLAQNNNAFTFTPSTDSADQGQSFTATFSVTDGINTAVSNQTTFTIGIDQLAEPSVGTLTITSPTGQAVFISGLSELWKDADLSIGTGSSQTFNYRYVKWNIKDNGGDSFTSAIEFELYDENNTKINISSASGPSYQTQTADNLIDGITTTDGLDKWSVSGSTAEIVFDLGSQQTIKKYRWATSNNVPERDPTSWTIEGSNDNSTWAVLNVVSDYSSTASRNTFNPAHVVGTAVNNSTFIDRSTNAHTVTPTGSPVQTAFHPYLDNWSVDFDGSGDELTAANDAGYSFGSGDFTVEMWINTLQTSVAGILTHASSGGATNTNWGLYLSTPTSNKVALYISDGSTYQVIIDSTTSVNDGSWHHIAATREGSTFRLFVDGTLEETATWSGSISSTSRLLRIGSNNTSLYSGHISNARIVKGTALYTANFTPPTEKLTAVSGTSLLACQSNRFIDNSASGHAITVTGDPLVSAFNPFGQESEYAAGENKGSVKFADSNSVYLSATSNDFAFGTGSFTVEGWYYKTSNSNTDTIVGTRTSASDTTGWSFVHNTSNYLGFYTSAYQVQSSVAVPLNKWYHFAITYDGTTLRLFKDGQILDTGTQTQNLSKNVLYMGATPASTQPSSGYLSELKIVKGTALYTSAFTPPTAPVGNTNASLYLPMDNAGIYDKTGNNTLTVVGDASTSTTQTKYADTAMYFDGSGDVVSTQSNGQNNIGTDDFTVEFWVYPSSWTTGNWDTIFSVGQSTNSGGLLIGKDNTENFVIRQYGIASVVVTSTLPNAGQWTHVACVRSSGTSTIYYNGTAIQSGADTTNYTTASPIAHVGNSDSVTYNHYFQGYIENLQVLKGLAKYTANFTVPSEEQGRSYQAES